ncbi:5'(3')-deoxyribonucleotidase, cytosolic type-like [Anneissia japonica]|uniref:5'(3')-deoxyribonucleotidase, cytosolic type-like n=1 Tax=Anneissia japonica TaxID=1529436 RepID=UPI001425BB72|nr:5'(3')-deoxyribonucleotidase, cytosolic type-like [Anneissia japonica]
MQRSQTILDTGKLLLLNINRSFSKNYGCTSPMKVLVSFDGCVAASEAHFLKEYRRRFPHEPYVRVEEREGIPLAHQYGRLRPDLVNNVETILKTSGFFVKMAPITGAIQALKEMQNSEELDVYLYVCPNQNSPKALHEKFQWIQKNLGQVFVERLIVAKDHAMLKADLHIDWKENCDGKAFLQHNDPNVFHLECLFLMNFLH